MRENQPFVRWLELPTQEGTPPEPKWVQLGFSSWEDHSNRKFFDKGQEWVNDDPPMKYQVNVRIDAAAADAIERQFGRPANADPPTPRCYEGDGSREAVNRARECKAAEIAKCHGYREEHNTFGPDYEWLIARSQDACDRVAPAVIQAVTGKKPDAIAVRQRVEALASFVQKAIPYTYEVDQELQARHRDGARRMGIRPPATALLRGGDCDTKSLLLAALIRSIDRGIPLALIDVKCKGPRDLVPVEHTIVGVGGILTKPGEQTRTIEGVNLLLIETTHGSFDRNNPFDWDLGHTAEDTDWNGSKATWISGNEASRPPHKHHAGGAAYPGLVPVASMLKTSHGQTSAGADRRVLAAAAATTSGYLRRASDRRLHGRPTEWTDMIRRSST
jgi:hypothetical protein